MTASKILLSMAIIGGLMIYFPILCTADASSLFINEVEQNPSGNDDGNEWIELHNNGSSAISLSGYQFKTADGETYNPSGSISAHGYLVITFPSQYLDNVNERVFLYHNGSLVDEPPMMTDNPTSGSGDGSTWQRYPDDSSNWVVRSGTQGATNGDLPPIIPTPPGNDGSDGSLGTAAICALLALVVIIPILLIAYVWWLRKKKIPILPNKLPQKKIKKS